MSDAGVSSRLLFGDPPGGRFPRRFPWRGEAFAAVSVWMVLVPSALAYASLAGLEPQAGLVGVPLALLGYGLFGGSKVLVVGADAAVSVLVGSALAGVAAHHRPEEAVVVLSVMVAAVYLALRLLRMGWVADLVPIPVLKGFVHGLAVVTIISRLPALLGAPHEGVHQRGLGLLVDSARSLDGADPVDATLGIVALVALVVMNRLAPRRPAAAIVLVASGVVVAAGHLTAAGVTVVGAPAGFLEVAPYQALLQPGLIGDLFPAAVAIVVLGFTESIGASELSAERTGEDLHPNRELLGLGAANLAVGLGASFPVTGTLPKTMLAVTSGARTRWTNLMVAGLAVVTALGLRPLFDYLATAVLAAVVIRSMALLIQPDYLRYLWRAGRGEFAVAVLVAVGVVLLGVMPAVVIGSVLSLVVLVRHVSRPLVEEHHPGRPGLVVVRLDGPLVFVNARVTARQILRAGRADGVRVVILDASAVTALDSTGLSAGLVVADRLRHRGGDLWLAAVNEQVWRRYQRLSEGRPVRVFDTVADAVAAFPADGRPDGSAAGDAEPEPGGADGG
ncbi:MAG: SulP family inorganic anion transporter [Acidimicrobiales bacterium]